MSSLERHDDAEPKAETPTAQALDIAATTPGNDQPKPSLAPKRSLESLFKGAVAKVSILNAFARGSNLRHGARCFVRSAGAHNSDLRTLWEPGTIESVEKTEIEEGSDAPATIKEVVVRTPSQAEPVVLEGHETVEKRLFTPKGAEWVAPADLCVVADGNIASMVDVLRRVSEVPPGPLLVGSGKEVGLATTPNYDLPGGGSSPLDKNVVLCLNDAPTFPLLRRTIELRCNKADPMRFKNTTAIINDALDAVQWICGSSCVVDVSVATSGNISILPLLHDTATKVDAGPLAKASNGAVPMHVITSLTALGVSDTQITGFKTAIQGAHELNSTTFSSLGLRGDQETKLTELAPKIGVPFKMLMTTLYPLRGSTTAQALEESKTSIVMATLSKGIHHLFRATALPKGSVAMFRAVSIPQRRSDAFGLEEFAKMVLREALVVHYHKKSKPTPTDVVDDPGLLSEQYVAEATSLLELLDVTEQQCHLTNNSFVAKLQETVKAATSSAAPTAPQKLGSGPRPPPPKPLIATGTVRDRDSIFVTFPCLRGVTDPIKFIHQRWMSLCRGQQAVPNAGSSFHSQVNEILRVLKTPHSVVCLWDKPTWDRGECMRLAVEMLRAAHQLTPVTMKIADVCAFAFALPRAKEEGTKKDPPPKTLTSSQMESLAHRILLATGAEQPHGKLAANVVHFTTYGYQKFTEHIRKVFGRQLYLVQSHTAYANSMKLTAAKRINRHSAVIAAFLRARETGYVRLRHEEHLVVRLIEELKISQREKMVRSESIVRSHLEDEESSSLTFILKQSGSFLTPLFLKIRLDLQLNEMRRRQDLVAAELAKRGAIVDWFETNYVYFRDIQARAQKDWNRNVRITVEPLENEESLKRESIRSAQRHAFKAMVTVANDEWRDIRRLEKARAKQARQESTTYQTKLAAPSVATVAQAMNHHERCAQQHLYTAKHKTYDVEYSSYWGTPNNKGVAQQYADVNSPMTAPRNHHVGASSPYGTAAPSPNTVRAANFASSLGRSAPQSAAPQQQYSPSSWQPQRAAPSLNYGQSI